jgi:phosphoribosylamine---glycine ligase
LAPTDVDGLLRFAKDEKIDFTIASSDRPLALGVVDAFQEENLKIFGPTKAAARLEWSKIWAAEFMKRHIPEYLPKTMACANVEEGLLALNSDNCPEKVVLKKDGLDDGKGVTIPANRTEAERAIRSQTTPFTIQEFLEGREVSFFGISDGINIVPLISAADHKQITEDPFSPMTGGMGGFAPAINDQETIEEIMEKIMKPVIRGMNGEGHPFVGALFGGLILTQNGIRVLEFNSRFGDPETQLQMRLFNSDLLLLLKNCVRGTLDEAHVQFHKTTVAAGVVLATEGYPENPIGGDVIYGLDKIRDPNVVVFHAGTKRNNGDILTTGGRAVMVTAVDKNLERARTRIRRVIGEEGIHFRGMQYRKDLVGMPV